MQVVVRRVRPRTRGKVGFVELNVDTCVRRTFEDRPEEVTTFVLSREGIEWIGRGSQYMVSGWEAGRGSEDGR